VRDRLETWIGCVAGAVTIDEYLRDMEVAGLCEIAIVPKGDYVASLVASDDEFYRSIQAELPEGHRVQDYVTSINASAIRGVPCCDPSSGCC